MFLYNRQKTIKNDFFLLHSILHVHMKLQIYKTKTIYILYNIDIHDIF